MSDIKDSFIQVDLGSTQIIRGISIAGNPNAQEWVSTFKVVYGLKANLVTYYYQEPYQILKVIIVAKNDLHVILYSNLISVETGFLRGLECSRSWI